MTLGVSEEVVESVEEEEDERKRGGMVCSLRAS